MILNQRTSYVEEISFSYRLTSTKVQIVPNADVTSMKEI